MLLLSGPAGAQTGWVRLAGGTQAERGPQCIEVLGPQTAVAAGLQGYIFRTTNRGDHWTEITNGITADLRAMDFCDERNGIVVGDGGAILRTTDGGATWRSQSNAVTGARNFSAVALGDSSTAVLFTSYGLTFRTEDGGDSWLPTNPPPYNYPLCVALQGKIGYAGGTAGRLYRTTDGGATWSPPWRPVSDALRDVWMFDGARATFVGMYGTILSTIDSGATWERIPSGTIEHFNAIAFHDSVRGIIGGQSGSIFRTADARNFSTQGDPPGEAIDDLSFHSASFGLRLTRSTGRMFRTTDGGYSWEELYSSWYGAYHDVFPLSADSAFAVGDDGRISFSSDAGEHWETRSGPSTAALRGVTFTDPLNGWAVGDSGVILHTTDAGLSWERQSAPGTRAYRDVRFPTPSIGIIVGDGNAILQTTDRGVTWRSRAADPPGDWTAVDFVDDLRGIVVSGTGTKLRTSDAGTSWTLAGYSAALFDVDWVDDTTILAAGRYNDHVSQAWPGVERTTDGGRSWNSIPVGPLYVDRKGATRGVAFSGRDFGFAVADGGRLASTVDGGATWSDLTSTTIPLNAVAVNGPRTAYAVGDSGLILRMLARGSIAGTVYRDADRDSVRDADEEGRAGWTLRLDGPVSDSTLTDAVGWYEFPSLPYGEYRVSTATPLYMDRTQPTHFEPDAIVIADRREIHPGRNFGVADPIVRAKVPLWIGDNTSFANRVNAFGARPGATRAIWGPFMSGSRVDSLEGEFEVPPRLFVQFMGIFDARFTDPWLPLNEPSEPFGEGTWTDVRHFHSVDQADTFLLSFLPGYYYGGGYPMTVRWPPEIVSQAYTGPVVMIGPGGAVTDMKLNDRVTVYDPLTDSVIIIARGPNIPAGWLSDWRLVSLPAAVPDASVGTLFPTAASRAYAFSPGLGYEPVDTLAPGGGYWLNYSALMDPLACDSAARSCDTMDLVAGWNLVGAPSAPVPALSILTDPPGLVAGEIFGYDDGYHSADTIRPGNAFWVRAEGAGRIILDGSGAGPEQAASTPAGDRPTIKGACTVRIADADGREATLVLNPFEGKNRNLRPLPPYPPPGGFDIRFASQSLEAGQGGGGPAGHEVVISSPRFPITVSLDSAAPSSIAVGAGGEMAPLRPGSSITIPRGDFPSKPGDDGRFRLGIVAPGGGAVPSQYALGQNYPNPFNPSTVIPYSLPAASRVRIVVYDVVGRALATVFEGEGEPGRHIVAWDARGFASGVYFYRMDAAPIDGIDGAFSAVNKLDIIK
jgi:photosystem II stability/assembly factor-like uncharacterized protein